MARLFDTTQGTMDEFHRALAGQGMTAEMIKTIIKDPTLVKPLVDGLKQRHFDRTRGFPELFISPELAYEAFLARARERNWPFTVSQLDELLAALPREHTSVLDSILALDIWLGDWVTTYQELWAWVEAALPRARRSSDLVSGKRVGSWGGVTGRYGDNKTFGQQPFVKWVEIKASNYRITRRTNNLWDAPTSRQLLQVLTAVALHPNWPMSMNHPDIPEVKFDAVKASSIWRTWDRTVLLHGIGGNAGGVELFTAKDTQDMYSPYVTPNYTWVITRAL